MNYYYDEEIVEENIYEMEQMNEKAEEKHYDDMELFYDDIKDFCKYKSANDILGKCSYMDLAKFVSNGEYELPDYMFEEKKDLVCLPPNNFISQSNNTDGWTTLRNKEQQMEYDNKQKKYKKEQQELQDKYNKEKLQKIKQREQEEWERRNKFNWTLKQ